MKTFLALAVLSLAASVTTQAASFVASSEIYRPKIASEIYRPKIASEIYRPKVASEIYRPKLAMVTTDESGTARGPKGPKFDLIAAEDNGTNRQPPRLMLGSIDTTDLNRAPSRPKFATVDGTEPSRAPSRPKLGESGDARKTRLNRADFVAAKVRPKVQSVAVTL